MSRESRRFFRNFDKTSNLSPKWPNPHPPAQQHQQCRAGGAGTHDSSNSGMIRPGRAEAPLDPQAGVVTAFVVVLTVALLLVAGLVFDGGRTIVAKRHAINLAEQAARAGAQAIDIATVRAGGPVRLNPRQARQAANAYLAAAGASGTVTLTRDATGELVSVVVPFSIRSSLLTLAGIPQLRGTGQASARNCQGVVQEETC